MTTAITDTFSTLNGSIARMIQWNQKFVEKTLLATHEESLRFINRRLECNACILESLRDNMGVSGIIAAEQNWFADAARDYVESGEKLRGRLFALAATGVQAVSEEGRATVGSLRATASDVAEKSRRASESVQRQAAE